MIQEDKGLKKTLSAMKEPAVKKMKMECLDTADSIKALYASSSKSSAAAADAAHPSPREEEGESDEGESEGDEEEDSDDSDGVGAAQLQAELLEVVSLIQSNDESEEAIGELRFFARSRLGPQADNLHASWGASTVDEVPADRLRHLCWLLLQH